MTCNCQVKDRDPEKPCPKCRAEPEMLHDPKKDERQLEDRMEILGMMTPRTDPRKDMER